MHLLPLLKGHLYSRERDTFSRSRSARKNIKTAGYLLIASSAIGCRSGRRSFCLEDNLCTGWSLALQTSFSGSRINPASINEICLPHLFHPHYSSYPVPGAQKVGTVQKEMSRKNSEGITWPGTGFISQRSMRGNLITYVTVTGHLPPRGNRI